MIFFSKKVFHLIVVGLIFSILSACDSNSNADLVSFVDSAYRDEKPEIEPLPPVEPYEEFIYSAANLTDPFNSSNVLSGTVDEIVSNDQNPDENRRKEPLEAFPLDGLRLNGVLEFKGKLSAIIRAPTGDSISVQVGNYVGQDSGKILSIDGDRQIIEVEETVRNVTGNFVKRIVTIAGESSTSTN